MILRFTVVLLTLILLPRDLPADSGEEVLATRGEAVLYQSDFDAHMSRIPAEHRAAVIRSPERFQKIVNNLLLSKQLASAGSDAGYDQEPLVKKRMDLASSEELGRAWLDHYLDEQDHADYEAMAREYYLVNKSEYVSELKLDVTHLLIGFDNREPEAALELAERLRAEIGENPAKFDSLVMEYSEDPSVSSNEGRFRNVARGQMVKPFETAAFSLQPGEISGPVETRFGYHLIRLDARREPYQRSYEEMRPALIEKMRDEHRATVRTTYLQQFQNQDVLISNEALQSLTSRYFDVPPPEMPAGVASGTASFDDAAPE
jgi:peptidyl-prolyl cis-trans isomerase C